MTRSARRPALLRDHARPLHDPRPDDETITARIEELVTPATLALVGRYREFGLRARLLTLPAMVALVLALVWRQIPSVLTLVSVSV